MTLWSCGPAMCGYRVQYKALVCPGSAQLELTDQGRRCSWEGIGTLAAPGTSKTSYRDFVSLLSSPCPYLYGHHVGSAHLDPS